MKTVFISFLLFANVTVKCQKATMLTLDQLNTRISKGKDTTYVINFWATWCVPCLKELPAFETLHRAYKDVKLKILLVSVDDSTQAVRSLTSFIKKKNLKNEVWWLHEKNQQTFIDRVDPSWSGSIPATLMIKGDKRRFFENDFTYSKLLTEYQHLQ